MIVHSLTYSSVVTIGLGRAIYQVTEGEPLVQVCASISGDLQRSLPLLVTLSTAEGTAQGEMVCTWGKAQRYIMLGHIRCNVTIYILAHAVVDADLFLRSYTRKEMLS